MALKKIQYDVQLLSTETVIQANMPVVYTNDLNSAEFVFNILDMTAEQLVGATATTLIYMRDGSFFQNSDVNLNGNTFTYLLKENEGNHGGLAKIQLVVKIGTAEYASQLYSFGVVSGLETKVAVEVMIHDWTTLLREARAYIAQFLADEEGRQATFVANEQDRQLAFEAAEAFRQQKETERQEAESGRIEAEQSRVDAEGTRQTTFTTNEANRTETFNANEATRQQAEAQRATAESVRVANEAERISKDSERDSKIEAVEGLQADIISGAVNSAAVQQHVEERYGQLEEEYALRLTEVTAQLAQKAATAALEVEKARIDNLIANAGNGTVPSELTDIRVGADAVTYPTAGAAVRDQFNAVNAQLAEKVQLKAAGNLIDFTKAIDNKYYNSYGTLLTGNNTTFAIPEIKLEVGRKYYLKAFSAKHVFRLCYLNADRQVTAYKTGAEVTTPITATANESYVLISFYNEALNNYMIAPDVEPMRYITQFKVLDKAPTRGLIIVNQKGDGDYVTIGQALTAIAGKDNATNQYTILVMPGKYNETIDLTNRYIDIVTLDKANTVIFTETGHYDYPPIKGGGGNIYVKGLKILANHDKPAPSFPNDNRAYGLHLDYSGSGLTVFEDCDIISYQCAALGTGTRPNRKHIFKDCKFELIDTGDGFNPASTKYGALFAHSHQAVAKGYQNYEFYNCIFKSDYPNAMRLLQSFSTFRCLFVNCFVQGPNKTISITNSVDGVSFIDADSFGNNATALNAQ